MNQVLFGDFLIDTDEIDWADLHGDTLPVGGVALLLHNGKTRPLFCEGAEAFRAWAKAPENRELISRKRCRTCAMADDKDECTRPIRPCPFPMCHVAKEEESKAATPGVHGHEHDHDDLNGQTTHVHPQQPEDETRLGAWNCSCGEYLARTFAWGTQLYGSVQVTKTRTQVVCQACQRVWSWFDYFGGTSMHTHRSEIGESAGAEPWSLIPGTTHLAKRP